MKLFKQLHVLPLLAIMLFSINLSAQLEFPEDKVSWEFSLEQDGCDAFVVAKITCIPHWHVYAANLPESSFLIPTEIIPEKSTNYELIGEIIEPKPEFYHDEAADEDIYQHSNNFVLKQKIKITNEKDFTLKGVFTFQTCDETHCLPPHDVDFTLKVKGCAEEAATDEGVSFKQADIETGDLEFPEDKVSWKFSVEQDGCDATIIGEITCVPNWHVYAANLSEESFLIPTEIEPEESPNYKAIGKIIEPEPEFYHDEAADEDIYQHSDTFIVKRKIKISSKEDFTLKGRFSFQTCDETHCLPPFDTEFELELKGCEGGDHLIEPVLEDVGLSLWAIFFIAFGSGLAALLTPVSFFTKQSENKAKGRFNAVLYGLFILLIYLSLSLPFHLFDSVNPEIYNQISTNPYLNIVLFLIFIIFAFSFLGAFELTLPNSWVNKADSASNKGGLVGVFFMALTLVLVSFTCTGPIIGGLLGATLESAGGEAAKYLTVGLSGFGLAFGLPFGLFAFFPGWLNSLPKSGGWLTTVKAVFGFLELAFAFKFLSNADLVLQGHWLEREVFLAIWIGVFLLLSLYLLGVFSLSHDTPSKNLSVTRLMFATFSLIFTIYLIPGLWGAPLKLISGFPPPMSYSESPHGVGGSSGGGSSSSDHGPEGTHLGAQSLYLFHDLDEGLAYAKKVGKPAFLDFTGWACVNCRKMEENVWGEAGVLEIMRDKVVIISLYVDEKAELSKAEQIEVEIVPGKTRLLKTVGNKWSYYQTKNYKTNTQPYYRMLGPNGEDLSNGSADYEHHGNKEDFKAWLEEGLDLYKKAQ